MAIVDGAQASPIVRAYAGTDISIIFGEAPGVTYRTGYDQGYSDGVASVPGKDLTSPVVAVVSIPTDTEGAVIIHAYDVDPGINLVDLTCQDRSDGPKYTVYDSEGFYHPFRGTRTGAGTPEDPYIFTVYRRGRWPTGISLAFKARVVDGDGNVTEVSA